MFTWKTQTREKPREPIDSNYHYRRERYNEILKGNDLKFYVFSNRQLQQKKLSISLSHTHCLYLYNDFSSNMTQLFFQVKTFLYLASTGAKEHIY